MVTVFLSLGSNVGQRRNMDEMLRQVALIVSQVKRSRLMETEPVEVVGTQERYLNCIVSGEYDGSAAALLAHCHAIEQRLGRMRNYRHDPRTADIDILLFGDDVVRENDLRIPHPGLMRRRFCLEGVREIAPGLIIPGESVSISAYVETLDESIKKQKINFID